MRLETPAIWLQDPQKHAFVWCRVHQACRGNPRKPQETPSKMHRKPPPGTSPENVRQGRMMVAMRTVTPQFHILRYQMHLQQILTSNLSLSDSYRLR